MLPHDLVNLIFDYQHPSRLVQLVEQDLAPLGIKCKNIGKPPLLPHALRDIFVHYADIPEQEIDGTLTGRLCMSRKAVRKYILSWAGVQQLDNLETYTNDVLEQFGSRTCAFQKPQHLTFDGFSKSYLRWLPRGSQMHPTTSFNLFISDFSKQADLLTR
jgi:hypothetical protein